MDKRLFSIRVLVVMIVLSLAAIKKHSPLRFEAGNASTSYSLNTDSFRHRFDCGPCALLLCSTFRESSETMSLGIMGGR